MTVASTDNRKTFTGDNVTTSFGTSPVVFFDTEDLMIFVVNTTTGAATTLTENTNYTVTGGSGSTGTVNLAGGSAPWGALATGTTLVILRDLSLVQEANFVQNDGSDAEVTEAALDKLTMMAQQLSARLDRSFVLADSDVSGASTEIPTPVASTVVGWSSTGNALQNYSATDLDLALTTSFTLTLLDDVDAPAARTTLGVGVYVPVTSPAGTNTITGVIPAANSTYAVGTYVVIPANTNTGAATLNLTPSGASALGAKNIFANGVATVGNELVAGVPTALTYDGTQFHVTGPMTQQNGAPTWIAGGGTADAITATYSPAIKVLVDGMMLGFRATAANATTTPTFAPNGLTARTITKRGGGALVAGDIPGNLAECLMRYNLANTRWELLNPAAINISLTNSIAGNVSLSNTGTFFDGPTVAQGTVGTWLAFGTVTLQDTAAAASMHVKLHDGTTVIDSALTFIPILNQLNTVALTGVITSPAGNIRISAKDVTGTNGLIIASATGLAKDSTLTVVRIA